MVRNGFWKMSSVLLAALGLALVLVFTGCGDDNGGGSGALGTTMNLSGPVYTWVDDVLAPFGGNRTIVSEPPGGEGAIVNGQFNFSFGRPVAEYLESIGNLFSGWEDEEYTEFMDFTIAPAAARGAFLWMIAMTGDTKDGDIYRLYHAETATSFTWRVVDYIFVDREVTISARGITETSECNCSTCTCVEWDDACFCAGTFTSRSFNITLREGWNALELREEGRAGANNTFNTTLTISHGNPGNPLRWALEDWDGWDGWSDEIELSGRARLGGTDARPSFRTRR